MSDHVPLIPVYSPWVVMDWYDGPLRSARRVTFEHGDSPTTLVEVEGLGVHVPQGMVAHRLDECDLLTLLKIVRGESVQDFFDETINTSEPDLVASADSYGQSWTQFGALYSVRGELHRAKAQITAMETELKRTLECWKSDREECDQEITQLTESVNSMAESMRLAIEREDKATAEVKRLQTVLQAAQDATFYDLRDLAMPFPGAFPGENVYADAFYRVRRACLNAWEILVKKATHADSKDQ